MARRADTASQPRDAPDSLRDALKLKITTDIIDVALAKMDKKYSMLICDDETIRILNYCMKMHELNEKNIGVVLNLKYNRERVNIHPIYFITPTEQSLDGVMADYAEERRTQYGKKIHVFFSGPVSQHLLEKIRGTPKFRRYLATLTEVHCDFIALEKRAFSLNRENSFRTLYVFRDTNRKADEIRAVARQLIGVCMTLDEDPYIRFSAGSRSAADLARLFEQQFGEVKANWQGFEPRPDRATLFILDRADDPFTPLVHEFSYQAMIMDLLNDKVDGRNIQMGEDAKEESVVLEDETDDVWLRYRHSFIKNVLEELPAEFNQWKESSRVVQLRGQENASTEGLIEAAREMPQYQSKIRAYRKHIDLAGTCSRLFGSRNILTISELEQDMGTGVNEDGRNADKTKIQQKMAEILQDDRVEKQIKLRLFMQYVISQGGVSRDLRNNIFQTANFSTEDQDIILNLAGLNVPLEPSRDSGARNREYLKELKQMARNRVETGEFTRYSSFMDWVLRHHLQDTLSTNDFPWATAPASQPRKTGGRSWRKAKKKQAVEADGPRLIVFVLGGMTYGEMRTCYQLSEEMRREIYIGSTQTLCPQKYLSSLRG